MEIELDFFFKAKTSVGEAQEDLVSLIHFIPLYQMPTLYQHYWEKELKVGANICQCDL